MIHNHLTIHFENVELTNDFIPYNVFISFFYTNSIVILIRHLYQNGIFLKTQTIIFPY